ncbi:LOW QUALITY PROTEIN: location of vulva defective 1 [Drosophila nasuta]|uniref:LOW QUALITY PROTEIN: location of vulva defective 1 n=1 Tax=Drosophila nasuta TaxID=42062 RepID=UPI00295E87B4|nr:LOW QUALITY PROTEIN: location of vulva defective 1 [Drosophila nasuta]
MTFYWWSHWFWITCLSVQLLPNGIPHVHTYPSQDISLESTTPQEQRMELTNGRRQPATTTTKLYQTTASQSWTAATQRNIMDLTIKTTATPKTSTTTTSYTPIEETEEKEPEKEEEQEAPLNVDNDDDDALAIDDINGDEVEEIDVEVADEGDVEKEEPLMLQHNQFEFKRSADFAELPAEGEGGGGGAEVAAILQAEQLNNYTNFSRSTSTNTNSSCSSCNYTRPAKLQLSTILTATTTTLASTLTRSTTRRTTTMPSTTTSLLSTSSSTESAPANSTAQSQLAATPSTPKINTEWLSDELQKAPFTLENANKEDELRRAESEHRSRKSKVLSAEYKHINRYINFSSDTKSLLTRSASSTPSINGYNPDEGNISSEALAIQRTYFLDAGAISAICFTVFGICCTVGTIGIVLYRRRYLNKPQALSEPDSSVYIDDSTMRDNSDEMYSLDNDSFLNSLEAMTIQNYWTDTVKHTKL